MSLTHHPEDVMTTPRHRLVLATALSTLPLFSCAAPDGEDSAVGVTTQALNGVTTYLDGTSCPDSSYRSYLQGLTSLAYQAFSFSNKGYTLQSWLEDGIWDGPAHESNSNMGPEWGAGYSEYVMKRMTENIATQFSCVNGVNQRSAAKNSMELVQYPVMGPAPGTPPTWFQAGYLAHEIAHTKGFSHEFGDSGWQTPGYVCNYPTSIPSFLSGGSCSNMYVFDRLNQGLSLVPVRQSELQETTLGPVGLHQGTFAAGDGSGEFICPGTTAASALNGSSGPGAGIPSLGLFCKPPSVDGPSVNSTLGAGTPTNYVESQCQSSEIMVGAWGYANTGVGFMGPICAPRSGIWADDPNTSFTYRPGFGPSTTGSYWSRRCPHGGAVKGMRIGLDKSSPPTVSRVELVCQRLATTEPISLSTWVNPPGANQPGANAGGFGWMADRCIGRQALTHLFAINRPDGVRIGRIEGRCKRFQKSVTNTTEGMSTGLDPNLMPLPGYGRAFQENQSPTSGPRGCPDSPPTVMVGMQVNATSNGVLGVQGICALPKDWQNTSIADPSVLMDGAPVGNMPASSPKYKCPRGKYLVGWHINDLDGVRGIEGICRPFTMQ
jgi:hypothetical protein